MQRIPSKPWIAMSSSSTWSISSRKPPKCGARKKSDGVVINAVFLSVLDGLRRKLSERRLDLAIFLHGPDEELFGSLRRLTERGLVDGVIIADTQHIDPRIDYLIAEKKPFVAFGRSLSGGAHPWVDPDFEAAVEGAVGHLVELG